MDTPPELLSLSMLLGIWLFGGNRMWRPLLSSYLCPGYLVIWLLDNNICRDTHKPGQPMGNWYVDLWGAEVMVATLPGGICTRRHDRMKTTLCIASRNTKHSRLLRTDFLVHLSSATGNMEQLIADSNIVRFGNKASDARKNSSPASCC